MYHPVPRSPCSVVTASPFALAFAISQTPTLFHCQISISIAASAKHPWKGFPTPIVQPQPLDVRSLLDAWKKRQSLVVKIHEQGTPIHLPVQHFLISALLRKQFLMARRRATARTAHVLTNNGHGLLGIAAFSNIEATWTANLDLRGAFLQANRALLAPHCPTVSSLSLALSVCHCQWISQQPPHQQ